MIHTRVRSFSDSNVEPTQGFGFLASRSNSAAISVGHCDLSFFSAVLSSMVRAMIVPPKAVGCHIYDNWVNEKIEAEQLTGAGAGHAVIVGGSMSGLLSGLLLQRAGWSIDIYERVDSELSGRGAGIVAQYELIERLRTLGLPTDNLGVHITTRKILDAKGQLTHEIECPQVLTAWERVYRLLRDAFPPDRYHRGRGLTKFAQDADKVRAHFSDGEIIEADLLVGADGIRSTVRQQSL